MSGKTVLSRERYEELLKPLTRELSDAARWIQETGQRVVIVFEGRDTAGKGGSIDMISQNINPRHCKVVALSAPTPTEQGQWYFQRYMKHLPSRGELVLFDRSWYNRAGVERVMGYCTQKQAEDFLETTPEFEKHLVDDGILLFKYWLCCSQAKQEKRFAERVDNPMKRWKLSSIDIESRDKYAEYTAARERMLAATHRPHAPWVLVDFENQALGRLTRIRDLLDRLPDTQLPVPEVEWPPLRHEPLEESYGVLQPIPPVPVVLDE